MIDSKEKAYWLGFLYADGCILEYKNSKTHKLKAMGLQLSLSSKDKEHIQLFLDCIESNAPIKSPIVKLGEKTYETSKVTLCCTDLCRDLINLGCVPRKTFTLKFPDFSDVPEKFLSSFIAGYFDGDGSVGRYESYTKRKTKKGISLINVKCPNFTILGNEEFLIGMNNYLHTQGINTVIRKYKSNIYEIRVTSIKEIRNFFEKIYRNSNICLDRKYRNFLKYY